MVLEPKNMATSPLSLKTSLPVPTRIFSLEVSRKLIDQPNRSYNKNLCHENFVLFKKSLCPRLQHFFSFSSHGIWTSNTFSLQVTYMLHKRQNGKLSQYIPEGDALNSTNQYTLVWETGTIPARVPCPIIWCTTGSKVWPFLYSEMPLIVTCPTGRGCEKPIHFATTEFPPSHPTNTWITLKQNGSKFKSCFPGHSVENILVFQHGRYW